MTGTEGNDPLGYIAELRDVLRSPALTFLSRVQVFYTSPYGPGVAAFVHVPVGTRVAAFFAAREPNQDPNSVLIRVNHQLASDDQELHEGDRITVTPKNIRGAYSATIDPTDICESQAPEFAATGRDRFPSRRSEPAHSTFERSRGSLDERWKAAERAAPGDPGLCAHASAFVSALGFCRLYGIELPLDVKAQLPSSLPPELLVPAIIQTLHMLESAAEDARALPEHFDRAEPIEDRSYCTGLLHVLMEAWAAFIVFDDEYQRYTCADQRIDSPFGLLMRRVLDSFSLLDDELQRDEQIQLLSIATELPLLDNWRKMLVEPYREPLPWWLDGTLERAADSVRDQVANGDLISLPTKTHVSRQGIASRITLAPFTAERTDLCSVCWEPFEVSVTGPAAGTSIVLKCDVGFEDKGKQRLEIAIQGLVRVNVREMSVALVGMGIDKARAKKKPSGDYARFSIPCSRIEPGDRLLITLHFESESQSTLPEIVFP